MAILSFFFLVLWFLVQELHAGRYYIHKMVTSTQFYVIENGRRYNDNNAFELHLSNHRSTGSVFSSPNTTRPVLCSCLTLRIIPTFRLATEKMQCRKNQVASVMRLRSCNDEIGENETQMGQRCRKSSI